MGTMRGDEEEKKKLEVKENRRKVFLISKKYEEKNNDIPAYTSMKKRDNKYRLAGDDNGNLLCPTGAELIAATKSGEVKWFVKSTATNLPKEIERFYCFYDVAYIVLDCAYMRMNDRLIAMGRPEIISFLHKDSGLVNKESIFLTYHEQKELLELIERSTESEYYQRRNKSIRKTTKIPPKIPLTINKLFDCLTFFSSFSSIFYQLPNCKASI